MRFQFTSRDDTTSPLDGPFDACSEHFHRYPAVDLDLGHESTRLTCYCGKAQLALSTHARGADPTRMDVVVDDVSPTSPKAPH